MIPTERDLPPAARAAARARVVAVAEAPARPARRWVPAVAALAVVAAVAVPVAALGRDGGGSAGAPGAPSTAPTGQRLPGQPPGQRTDSGPPPGPTHASAPWTPAPNPSHTLPAETTIADRCLDGTGAGFAAGMSMRALFTDERGYVAYVAARNKLIYCAFAWDGSLDHRSASTEGPILPDAYAPARSPAGLGGLNNMVDGSADRLPGSDRTLYSAIYYGSVTKDVRSVTLTVQGVGPVQADLRGPAWIARVVFHGPADRKRLDLRTVITTYDANGRTIGAFRIFG
jgi:hypothetical protein